MRKVTTLVLYRGIAVPSETAKDVISNIQSRGLDGEHGFWRFVVPDVPQVRRRIDILFQQPCLTTNDFLQETPFRGVCACGDPLGAEFYAGRHNFSQHKNNYPIVIEFEISLDQIYVDSRDFLCSAFQFWDRYSARGRTRQKRWLTELFGKRILRYFDSVCQNTDQTHRIAMGNLAAFDERVIEAHYSNQKVIAGRYGTVFKSAFFVQGPVPPERIRRLYTFQTYALPSPDLSLDQFLGR
jgi:hypothetical protein